MRTRRLAAALAIAATASLSVALAPAGAVAATAKPTVSGVSLPYGKVGGGATVTLTGTNFTGVTAVRFGTTAGTRVAVASRTKLTVVAPAHAAGTVDVRVTTAGGTSAVASADRYVYTGAPVITSFTPSHGRTAGGDDPVLSGTGFSGVTAVKVDGTAVGYVTFHDLTTGATTISPQMPPHAEGYGLITVTAVGGTSTPVSYTYVDKPVIHLSPAAGPANTAATIHISGTGLRNVTALRVDGVDQGPIFFDLGPNGSGIVLSLPPHAPGTSSIVLDALGGTSDPVTYTYTG